MEVFHRGCNIIQQLSGGQSPTNNMAAAGDIGILKFDVVICPYITVTTPRISIIRFHFAKRIELKHLTTTDIDPAYGCGHPARSTKRQRERLENGAEQP